MGRRSFMFFLFVGLALVVFAGVLFLKRPPEPPMRWEQIGSDIHGEKVYAWVPLDEDAEEQLGERRLLTIMSIVFAFFGFLTAVPPATFLLKGPWTTRDCSSPWVFVRDEGSHYHTDTCERLICGFWLFPSDAVGEGFEPCSRCRPPSSGREFKVFVAIGDKQFHKRGCVRLPAVCRMRRLHALANGYQRCPACRA
jgi:hypothetical protein